MSNQMKWNLPQTISSNPSPFLAARICEDSNLEMEWLWAAEQVPTAQEQRYCLERALHINPQSAEAGQQFDALTRTMETVAETAWIDNPSVPGFRLLLKRLFQPGTRPICR